MPTDTALAALIERVEGASGGDYRLSQDIGRALNLPRRYEHPGSENPSWPNYTGSFDAARTIDPGAMIVFASDIGADGLPMVKLVSDTTTTPIVEHTGIAPTLERALCAAALRALQAARAGTGVD